MVSFNSIIILFVGMLSVFAGAISENQSDGDGSLSQLLNATDTSLSTGNRLSPESKPKSSPKSPQSKLKPKSKPRRTSKPKPKPRRESKPKPKRELKPTPKPKRVSKPKPTRKSTSFLKRTRKPTQKPAGDCFHTCVVYRSCLDYLNHECFVSKKPPTHCAAIAKAYPCDSGKCKC